MIDSFVRIRRVCFVLCAPFLVACAEEEPSQFEREVAPIFSRSCTEGCHEPGGEEDAESLDLRPSRAHAALVGVPSLQVPSMMLVEPGSVEESYLWHKLDNSFMRVGGEGEQMPYALEPLTKREMDIIKQWIESGAAK